jgi:hypothetical protein
MPFVKWFTADYHRDTEELSATCRGIWVDFLNHMGDQPQGERGRIVGPVERMAKIGRCTVEEAESSLLELHYTKTADVILPSEATDCYAKEIGPSYGNVTGKIWVVMNRRILREEAERTRAREGMREKREREKEA